MGDHLHVWSKHEQLQLLHRDRQFSHFLSIHGSMSSIAVSADRILDSSSTCVEFNAHFCRWCGRFSRRCRWESLLKTLLSASSENLTPAGGCSATTSPGCRNLLNSGLTRPFRHLSEHYCTRRVHVSEWVTVFLQVFECAACGTK